MGFTALSAERTRRVFARLGDPCTVTPQGGDPIATTGIFEPRAVLVGELAQQLDSRITIELLAEDVGRPRRGTVEILGKVFDIDQPVQDQNPDDGIVVSYYLRKQANG